MNEENEEKEASRETGWSEASPQDKVERLRFAVKNIEQGLLNLGKQLSDIQSQIYSLKFHEHANGKVVVPIDRLGGIGLGSGLTGQLLTRKNPLDD